VTIARGPSSVEPETRTAVCSPAPPTTVAGNAFRLPCRPNDAAGWINAGNIVLAETPWRIEISTAPRTLTLFYARAAVRTISVVVGKPSTPSPTGLFAITEGGIRPTSSAAGSSHSPHAATWPMTTSTGW